jgi:hypothetical protein
VAVWVQTPHPQLHPDADGYLPVGYPPNTREITREFAGQERLLDWAFAGQVTHIRRRQLHEQLVTHPEGGFLLATDLFASGLPQHVYLADMTAAKVAPCPGGPQTPDTFRLWEALQAGCVPLVDTQAGERDLTGYWDLLWGHHTPPFPLVNDWETFPQVLTDQIHAWPAPASQAGAWWLHFQRASCLSLRRQLVDLGGLQERTELADLVTVVVPTSPVPANPDFGHLLTTLDSIADAGLGACEVIITCDGVRPEQEHLLEGYTEAVHNLVTQCLHEWPSVLPVVHTTHQHQARMMRHALDLVTTPLVLYVEHDCPLNPGVDWDRLTAIMLNTGRVNLVRFHHEDHVLDEHRYLMANDPTPRFGLDLWRCEQWSQRPHLARTDYYRRIMDEQFHPDERWMIEDRMHGVLQDGDWEDHRVWMYAEEGDTGIKYSRHLDARQGEPKWVDK